MRLFIFINFMFIVTVGILMSQSSSKFDLKDYQWKNRIILVFSPSETDSAYLDAEKLIEKFRDEILDRDLVTVHLFENGSGFVGDSVLDKKSIESLRNNYKAESGKFTIVLIGKDGGEKLRQQGKIDFKTIFERIDSMPMRQQEMKRRKRE